MADLNGLVLWNTIRLPGTCQTITDIDDVTGELLVNVWGEPPAPAPPSEAITGSVIAGRCVYRASENRFLLIDVETEPM